MNETEVITDPANSVAEKPRKVRKPRIVETEIVSAGELVPTPQTHQTGWLAVIDKMLEKNVGAELLSKVFEMQQASEREMARREFVAAFAAFKAEAPTAIGRTGSVHYDGKHAYDHVELDNACAKLVPVLSKHGLAHSWETNQADNGLITVTCRVEHEAGHAKEVTLKAMPDTGGKKQPIQAIGSAVYYLERYTFLAALGIAQGGADDDAGGVAGNGQPAQKGPAKIGPNEIEQINTLWDASIFKGSAEESKSWKQLLEWAGCKSLDQMDLEFFPNVRDHLTKKAVKK